MGVEPVLLSRSLAHPCIHAKTPVRPYVVTEHVRTRGGHAGACSVSHRQARVKATLQLVTQADSAGASSRSEAGASSSGAGLGLGGDAARPVLTSNWQLALLATRARPGLRGGPGAAASQLPAPAPASSSAAATASGDAPLAALDQGAKLARDFRLRRPAPLSFYRLASVAAEPSGGKSLGSGSWHAAASCLASPMLSPAPAGAGRRPSLGLHPVQVGFLAEAPPARCDNGHYGDDSARAQDLYKSRYMLT